MIIIFLVLSFLRTLRAAPTASTSSLDIYTLGTRNNSTNDTTTRTTYELVRGCFATIFACVWKSVHPNISGPRDSGWTRMKRRLITTIYVLVAPELMALWALRQYFAARDIANDYNNIEVVSAANPDGSAKSSSLWDPVKEWFSVELPAECAKRRVGQKWTTTHGFFIQMGGFLLYENDKPTKVLYYDEMKELIEKGRIDAPIYTETDLQDRSKGDVVSKGLVILQTTWFVVQCITRLCGHLPLSELEVVTLGFAVLNGIIYGIWWKKPQGVGAAIFIPLKAEGFESTAGGSVHVRESGSSVSPQETASASAGSQVDESQTIDGMDRERGAEIDAPHPTPEKAKRDVLLKEKGAEHGDAPATGDSDSSDVKKSWLRRELADFSCLEWILLTTVFPVIPFLCACSLLIPLNKMAGGGIDMKVPRRVPMFYADARGDDHFARAATCGIGIFFGLVHLFGWWSESLSPKQLHYWHISTIITIAAPVEVGMAPIFMDCGGIVGVMYFVASLATVAAYLVSRFTLITLAFIALHVQAPKILETVSWSNFIPHV